MSNATQHLSCALSFDLKVTTHDHKEEPSSDHHKYSHSCVLFIDASGDPIKFYMRPIIRDSQTLKELIEFGGGIVVSSPANDVIRLVDRFLNVQEGETAASVQYVYDCVKKNKMLDIEPYLIKVYSEDVSDLDDVSSDGDDDVSHMPYRTSSRSRREPYSAGEDEKLLRYVLNNPQKFLEMTGAEFCNETSEKQVVMRSSSAISHRLERLLDSHKDYLDRLNLHSEEKTSLIKLFNKRKHIINRPPNYTKDEDQQIIQYIVKNKLFSDMHKAATFEAMRDSTQLSRSAKSLQKRLNRILENIHSYHLPPKIVWQFLNRTSKSPSISSKRCVTRSQSDAHCSSDSSLQARTVSVPLDTNSPAKKRIKRLFTDNKLEQRLETLNMTPRSLSPPKSPLLRNNAPKLLQRPIRINGSPDHLVEKSNGKKQVLLKRVFSWTNEEVSLPTRDSDETDDSCPTVALINNFDELEDVSVNRLPQELEDVDTEDDIVVGAGMITSTPFDYLEEQVPDLLSLSMDSFDANVLKQLPKCMARHNSRTQQNPLFDVNHVDETIFDNDVEDSNNEELLTSGKLVDINREESYVSETDDDIISSVNEEAEQMDVDATQTEDTQTNMSVPETASSVPMEFVSDVMIMKTDECTDFLNSATLIVMKLEGAMSTTNNHINPNVRDKVDKDLQKLKLKLYRELLTQRVQTIMRKPKLTINDRALLLKYLCHFSQKSPRKMLDELTSNS